MTLGLTLASSDVNYLSASTTGLNGDFSGALGAAAANSFLSSPLTSGGDFCRTFYNGQDAAASGRKMVLNVVSSSVDGGIYAGPLSSAKAYSIRAWLRTDHATGNTFRTGIGMSVRTVSSSVPFTGTDISGKAHPIGYTVQLGGFRQDDTSAAGSTNVLSLGVVKTNGQEFGTPIDCSGSAGLYAAQVWHRVRMDVIPVGTTADTINVYTSSAGDVPSGQETWELVGTQQVMSTDAGYLNPTDNDVAIGWYAWGTGDDSEPTYIDQFEILVEDI
jgi:hypothetical protein